MATFIPNVAIAATGSLVYKSTPYTFNIEASSDSNGNYGWKAFDGDPNTAWVFGWSVGAGGAWVSIKYSSPILVNYLTFRYSAIESFKIQGWNGTSWIDIKIVQTNENGITNVIYDMEICLDNTVAYLGYRIVLLSTIPNGTAWAVVYNVSFAVVESVNYKGNEVLLFESPSIDSIYSSTNLEDNKLADAAAKNSLAVEIESKKATLTPNNKFSYDISDSEGLFKATDSIGENICVEQGNDTALNRPGIFFEKNELGTENGHTIFGGFIADQEASIQYDRYLGISHDIKESNSIPPILRNFSGIDLTVIEEQTYASNHYTLLVTATHQYRSAIVNVHAKTYGRRDFRGSYQLLINGAVAVDYSVGELDITIIDINLSSGQLLKGVNKCWLNIKHSGGYLEYLDFEVFKEEARRTSAERLFRDYDGGFDGKYWSPPQIVNFGNYPCAAIPEYGENLLITTTDATSINLKNILTIQNLVATGKNFKVLVSFDGRLTWKAFSSNSWSTISLGSISACGMTITTINSITEAQWGDIITNKNLDLAIYLDNASAPEYLWGDSRSGPQYDGRADWYTVPRNIKITRVEDLCARRGVYAWVYSINNPGGINVAGQHYVVPTNDRVTGIQVWCRWNGYDQDRWVIYGKTYDTNLKSIRVNMTVNPFKGYAFII